MSKGAMFAVAALAGLLLTAQVGAPLAQRASAGPPQPDARPVWEYSTLTLVYGRTGYARLAGPSGFRDARTMQEIYAHLAGREASREFHHSQVLNQLGGRGWELVSHAAVTLEQQQVGQAWTFKRPKQQQVRRD